MDANILWAKITACWESITKQVRFIDHGDYLVSKGVFSLDDYDHLRTKTGRDQTTEMLLVMHRKRPDAAFHFIASLRRECAHVASEIEDHELDTQEDLDNNTPSNAGETESRFVMDTLRKTEESKRVLESQLRELQGEQDTLKKHRQTLESQVQKLQGDVQTSKQELEKQAKEFQGELDILKKLKQTLESQVQTLQGDVQTSKQELEKQAKEFQESETWKLVEGWEKNIEVEKSDTRMSEEMKKEVMDLTKKAAINSLGDLDAFVTFVGDTFNERHGKYWQCVVGPSDTFKCWIWSNAHEYISLDVKLSSINMSLRLVLFKARRDEWFYPIGWKNDIKVDIVKSEMPESQGEESKELVLQAVRRRSAGHTVEDMNDIAEFIRDTWEQTHAGYWQAVAGESGRYGCYVRKASESYIQLDVKLTAVKEKMRILLFKAKQDK